MLNLFRQWRNNRALAKSNFTSSNWARVASNVPILDRLSDSEKSKLYDLATLFLHGKTLSGAHDFILDDAMRQSIALQACLPILNLGLKWYSGWSSIIVYPEPFRRESTSMDEFGVAHKSTHGLSGEAWLRGPVVLSWRDTVHAGERDGHNVVIHEFVHKLDMLNGRANGFPPMQPDMSPVAWATMMSEAFDNFQNHPKPGLDRYGATNPAEFFAVLSEVFFETPAALVDAYPAVYELMTRFYRQTPAEKAV